MKIDPYTVALDALAAAGQIVRTVDQGTFDPVRAGLAEHFAPLATSYNGFEADQLARAISPQLAAAVAQVRRQLDVESSEAELRLRT